MRCVYFVLCDDICDPRTYFPLIIIVSSSWVSFWLVNTPAGGEIVARVGLGITCCLGNDNWTGFFGGVALFVPFSILSFELALLFKLQHSFERTVS